MNRLLALSALLLCSLVVLAYDFSVDGKYYNITSAEGYTVELTSQGQNSYNGDIVIPEKVVYDGKEYTVTSIGGQAFEYCRELKSVTIPNSVTSIGMNAFSGSTNLTTVNFPNSVTSIGSFAFYQCKSLESIIIPNSVTSIFCGTFEDCVIKYLYIPESVKEIDGQAFWGSTFEKLELHCETLGGNIFNYVTVSELILGNGVKTIENMAFNNCGGFTSLTIPNSVTSIEGHFNGCRDLISITFNCNVVTGCIGFESLKEVTLGENVTSIGSNAFKGCSGLTSISIPNSVTSIGYDAFSGCTGLEKVIAQDISAWCNIVFGNGMANPLYYAHHLYSNENTEITGLVIPNGVTSIRYSAFYDCSGLTSVTIPNSVTSIGGGAFSGCSGLTTISIPNSVTSIGGSAFSGCSGLTSISIPNSVTSIGGSAFSGCSGLTTISIPNSVTSIGSNAFSGCSGLTSINVDCSEVGGNWFAGLESFEIILGENVTSIGDLAFYGCSGLTSISIPNSVTSIGGSAFSGCSGLTSISIPNSVTSIGSNAFKGCSDLTSVNVDCSEVGSWWFSGYVFIEEVTLGENVTSIGGYAFSGCSGLTSVTIGNSVTSIGLRAFYNCNGLTSISIPNSVTSIGDGAFEGCSGLTSVNVDCTEVGSWFSGLGSIEEVTLSENVTSIGWNAFSGCSGLTSISIPNSVKSIGGNAFSGCSGLTSFSIPNSVTTISDGAFSYCDNLASIVVSAGNAIFDSRNHCNAIIKTASNELIAGCSATTIPNSVTRIGTGAFRGCANLATIDIPTSVTYINSYAFEDCTGLTAFVVPSSISSMGSDVFKGCDNIETVEIYCRTAPNWFKEKPSITTLTLGENVTSISNNAFQGCTGLTTVTIPNSVTSIGEYAFSNCTGLTTITISNSVKTIGNYAFWNCSGLESVEMGNAVTSIGVHAFNSCSGLTTFTLPSTVNTIGRSAFYGCSGLTTVTAEMATPVSIDETVFENRSDILLYVRMGCKDAYLAAPYWQEFLDIVELDTRSEQTLELTEIPAMNYGDAAYTLPKKTAEGLTLTWSVDNSAVATVGGNTLTLTGAGTAIVTATQAGNDSYKPFSREFELVVGKAVLTITANDCIKEEGDENPELTVSYSGFVNGEDEMVLTTQPTVTTTATTSSPAGTYPITVSGAAAANYEFTYVNGTLTINAVETVTVGDLNGDGTVSITDVVLIIDVMAGIITDANQVAAADVNGDGDVTITDCVAAIDLIAAQQGNSPLMAMAPSMQPSSDYISGNYLEGKLTVDLCNENRYTAFQMVVSVPDGMRIVKALMNRERGEEHQVMVRAMGSGQYLVAGFSLDNEELTGNNGSLLTIMTEGECSGDIVVSDVEFATVEAEAWHLAGITVNGSTTGIANMETDAEQTVYDLQGRKLDSQILRSQRIQGSNQIVIVNGKKVVIK